jgi:hypothetical protein
MNTLVRLGGIFLFLLGLLFMAQGSGYLAWPRQSFMVGAQPWVYYGGAIAAAGLLLVVASR